MNIKILAGAAVLFVIIIVIGAIAFTGYYKAQTAQINISAQSGQKTVAQAANSSKTLFSSTQYFPYAYQVYPGPTSQQAQAALAGFNITSAALQNSSTKITLSLLGSGQQQSMILKPGYKLYLIETTFGDDGFHFDSSLGDDGFVIVDQNGYLAQ